MHPILFKLGFIEIRFYGLMYVAAILVATRLIRSEVKRKGIGLNDESVMNLIVSTVIGGIVGARLYYVAFNSGYYLAHPIEIPAIWHGGLAIHGGLIGGASLAWFYLKRHGVSYWRMADAVAPTLILGQAFGRFGNFMNGDAHGLPTNMPWGIVFPTTSIAGSEFPGIPLHPTMLYEMSLNLTIFVVLWFVLRKRAYKDGFLFASYMAMYSLGRIIVEQFRADSLMFGSIKTAQAVSLTLLTISIIAIAAKGLWKAER